MARPRRQTRRKETGVKGARILVVEARYYEDIADTLLRGANERLVPILMTAAVTALGLAPLAFGVNKPGQEIEGPMAITVLGGLFSSTLLNLFILPALAFRFVTVSREPTIE